MASFRIVELPGDNSDAPSIITLERCSKGMYGMPLERAMIELRSRSSQQAAEVDELERQTSERESLIQSWSDNAAQMEYIQDALEGVRLRGSDLVDQGLLRSTR